MTAVVLFNLQTNEHKHVKIV